MEKAKEILFKVGVILSYVFAGLYLLSGVITLITGITAASAAAAEESAVSLGAAIGSLISTVIFAVLAIINSRFILKVQAAGAGDDMKKLYIFNIVFGIISGVVVNAIGAIFGLILDNKGEENNSSEE